MGDIHGRRRNNASDPDGGASAKGNRVFLSMADSDADDIEHDGSTTQTPQSSPDSSIFIPGRRDNNRSHGGGSSSGRGGEAAAAAAARRNKRLPLRTPNPSTPEGDGSGGGLGDRAPFDRFSSAGVGSAARQHSSLAPRDGSTSSTSRGRHTRAVESSRVSTAGIDKPDLRRTGVAGGGRRRTRHEAKGRGAEDTTGGGGGDGGGGGSKHRRGSESVGGGSTSRDRGGRGVVCAGGGGSGGRNLGGSGAIDANVCKGQEPALRSRGCMSTATVLKLVTLLFALYNVSILWARHYHPKDGKLCAFIDRGSCVTSTASKALLTMARFSAGGVFPSVTFCFLSKCYASRYLLHNSWLALIVDFEPTHNLHTYFGGLAVFCSVIHGASHIARAAYENNPDGLVVGELNRSGLVALPFLLVTALPMSIGFIQDKLTYEIRKLLHLLFIPFMVAICFHGRPLRILGAVLLAWYLLDRLYFTTKMTFLVSAPTYKSVGRGTLVRFELPVGYQYRPGAYVQVNCPAISAHEWHPFSMFPVPGSRPRAGFHIEAVGDWTDEFFRLCLENPSMPLWITAAQPSVVERTAYYDNVVLVCTGAGITPAVSVTERFAKKKNVHLLWLSRDPGMIAMFEKQLRRVKSTVYLTGKPSEKTKMRMIDLLAPSKGDVVATTTASALGLCSRSSSYRSDLNALEDGGGGGSALDAAASQASIEGYRGVLKDDDDDDDDDGNDEDEQSSGRTSHATEYGGDDDFEGSSLGGLVWGGASSLQGGGESLLGGRSSLLGGADSALGAPSEATSSRLGRAGGATKKRHHRRRSSTSHIQRARGYNPVAVNFGRSDIEKYISETIQGTAIQAEWAPVRAAGPEPSSKKAEPIAEEPLRRPVSGIQKMLKRLNTMQRISKRDLMEADLSMVDIQPAKLLKPAKPSNGAETGFDALLHARGQDQAAVPAVDTSSWLVLYCGANAHVERAVASACDRLEVKWCKEYFSKW